MTMKQAGVPTVRKTWKWLKNRCIHASNGSGFFKRKRLSEMSGPKKARRAGSRFFRGKRHFGEVVFSGGRSGETGNACHGFSRIKHCENGIVCHTETGSDNHVVLFHDVVFDLCVFRKRLCRTVWASRVFPTRSGVRYKVAVAVRRKHLSGYRCNAMICRRLPA